MTRKEIDYLIGLHEAHLRAAKKVLDEDYERLERRGEEGGWLDLYRKHSQILRRLRAEKADDE